MTNEFNGEPMGKHAQQLRVNQVASQLSESLPVVNVDTTPQYTGNPVITFMKHNQINQLSMMFHCTFSQVNLCSWLVILVLVNLRLSIF